MQRVFALTTRGLERTGAAEIAQHAHGTITQLSYRRIAFTVRGAPPPLAPLLGLRTVDDVFLDVATWHGIARPRSTLDRIAALSARLDLSDAARQCARVRRLPRHPTFSVSAGFVGKRNYRVDEIKAAVAEPVGRRHSWAYRDDDGEADLNLRLFIEHETACVGVRLGAQPLHRRAYKLAHVPGSLKPTVAAAMVALAGAGPSGADLLDPCCGAGTILIEAALQGWTARGGDLSEAALEAARLNARAAGTPVSVQSWDARALPLPDASTPCIVTNLPWGRQVPVEDNVKAPYGRLCAELRRVLAPGGRIVLLTTALEWVRFEGLRCEKRIEISLYGRRPEIMLYADPTVHL